MVERNLKKMTKVNDPHEIYHSPLLPDWEWRVLQHYQKPENEAKNPQARVFCAVKSPMTFDSYDLGDVYLHEMVNEMGCRKIEFNKEELEKW